MTAINIEKINIDSSWKELLRDEFSKDYFLKIKQCYLEAKQRGDIIYPSADLTFNAFKITPLDKLKVVILGQDPYIGENQAMGLSFSVPNGVKIPPSLQNIFKEIHRDLGILPPKSGDLTKWGYEGVLLLNAILSVKAREAGSHQNFGWQKFTDAVISAISKHCRGIVFLLWGNFARAKKSLIDSNKHLILEAAHPSPLARGGFIGCSHFSKTNAYLVQQGKTPIDWEL